MVISGDFTNIVSGIVQPKVENKKPPQSEQASKTQFGDVLKKNEDDNLTTFSDSKRQATKADADEKYSDKIANDKAANNHALSDKQAGGKASTDKITNAKSTSDQVSLNNSQQVGSYENKITEKDHNGNKEGKLKSSSQEEQNSDDSAASSINHYLSHLNSPKVAATKNWDQDALPNKSEGSDEVTETDGVDGKNHEPINSQLLAVKEKLNKLNTVDNAIISQSNAGKVVGAIDEAIETQKSAQGHSTVIDKNKVQSAATDSDFNLIKGESAKDTKTQSTAAGTVADAHLKTVDPALQKEFSGPAFSLKNGTNGAANNGLSGQLVGTAQAKAQDKVKTADKDSTGKIENKNDIKNRTGFADSEKVDFRDITTDDKSGVGISERKQTSGRRVQNGTKQAANSINQQTNVNTAPDKLQAAPTLDVGDKVAATNNGTKRRDVLGHITDVEVTENRKVGEIQILRIKLNPENLGMVEARLRKTSDGLQIEIQAESQDTARLLAADRHMLSKAIEKSGFNNDGHLTILIVDRSSQTVQQGQASNSGQSTLQDNSGQNYNGQRQFSGQQGQSGHNESRQTFTEFPFTGTPLKEENIGEEATYRNPRHLVV